VFGLKQYEQVNSLINRRLAEVGVLVVSHRGAGVGSAAQNTALGVRGALASGAEMVEIDVAASSDGTFYCFHDGTEPEALGIDDNIQYLSAEEIDKLRYIRVDRPGRPSPVERLLPLLKEFQGTDALFNLDRSWWRWPAFLKALESLGMIEQITLKCPAWDLSAVGLLSKYPVKYPFVPICSSMDDVDRVIGMPGLNTIGVELLTEIPIHPWLQRETIDTLHERGVFTLASTVTLPTGVPLFGGYDDEKAVLGDPADVFAPLMDLGIDAIQTDWPWLLKSVRDSRATLAE
jgi:glycerophosphoryl diester phosphodiesterase